MGFEDNIEKMQLRQEYRNFWHIELMKTMTENTSYCCFACFCAPCASYLLRKRALYDNMSRYTCCAGYMPCSGKCGESKCPELCLCTEVWCCLGNSVASTRFLLQDEFNIQTTKCDNCIIGFMICLGQVACIFSIIACLIGDEDLQEASQCLSCLSDAVFCAVCSCIQTQHQIEMDKRDGKLGGRQAPEMGVPPIQQMSRIDQPIPPSAGYPPQPGYEHGYPYPPHAQGYPNAGYPPPPTYKNDQYPPPNQHPTYRNDQFPPPNHHPTYTNDQYPPYNHNPAYPNDAYPPTSYNPK